MVPSLRYAAPARALALLLPTCLLVPGAVPVTAEAREGDWYVGAGASAAFLRPDADVTGFEADEGVAAGATLFLGLDLEPRIGAQLQLHGLGEGEFESGESVDYLGAEAAALYRFVDNRPDDSLGLSLYAHLGLGVLDRDSDVDLENERGVYLGAGIGAELHLDSALAVRAEGVYHESDAASLAFSLVFRFRPPDRHGESSSRSWTPVTAPRTLADDADSDGVDDAADACPASAVGFPVRDNGCALLEGVLGGVDFVDGTATLAPGAAEQLDYLANLLARYPEARIKLLVHTDDAGSVREQSILTRARLRTIGLYLVQRRGIRSNRIVLRSLGATRPLYSNTTPENRRLNNRVEVLENTD